ncbi:DUF2336 domain-containing protein [Rhizobium sp. C4]|uniref:DUF2336 domain-containing protein n=1 Tax=Rhizobium sp. C4 TaxID=1349800 RepID=UPI001E2AD307|nr:DUF2336 domain-containing protein [Rhizobium sp. C4]MCD2175548.1 DUF2336 domain-containing protein [Rhizobium sp. C4]
MATVTSFEALSTPTRMELKQFAELFRPLYEHSTPEARRQAVAALSRLETLPQAVCFFVGSEPIGTAAIFLSQSPAISDATLIDIARSQGEPHARAIATRSNLSPIVVDALAALHDGSSYRRNAKPATETVHLTEAEAAPAIATASAQEEIQSAHAEPSHAQAVPELARLAREEALRNELRQLVAAKAPEDVRPAVMLRAADEMSQALLVRFARARQMPLFARVMTDVLDASAALSERILLDVSGQQLASTLIALGLRPADTRQILTGIYPHLAQIVDGRNRAFQLVRSLDPAECVARVIAWRRADIYTRTGLYEDVEADVAAQAVAAAGNNNDAAVEKRSARS